MKITVGEIESKIFTFRGIQVMVDRDLAKLYDVDTKRLNEQVKRNIERFPDAFRFQLTENEKNELVANCDRLNSLKHSSSLPYVFTEQGVSMLSAVLRSDTAIQTSIQIINSFVQMRKFLSQNAGLFQRLDSLEKKQIETDTKLEEVLGAIEDKSIRPKQGIFYDGEIFDAYVFVSDLIKSAKRSIVLIDNYVDESVLTMLDKRAQGCSAVIYTKTIPKQLALDLKKHNAQYPAIEIRKFTDAHDRFLIIDDDEVYHIGASLKYLGKKWFAFSRIEKDSLAVTERLKEIHG
jgi:hypothetical protein